MMAPVIIVNSVFFLSLFCLSKENGRGQYIFNAQISRFDSLLRMGHYSYLVSNNFYQQWNYSQKEISIYM